MPRPRLLVLLVLAAWAAVPVTSSTDIPPFLPAGYCYEVSAGSLGIDQGARICPPGA